MKTEMKTALYETHLGDCLDLIKNVSINGVDAIITDPPYFLSNDGVTCKSGKMVSVNKGEWDKLRDDIDAFNAAWIRAGVEKLKIGGSLMVFGTHHNIYSVGHAIQNHPELKILNNITWIKKSPPPNLGCRNFTHSTETILWARKGHKSKHTFNYKLMKLMNGGKQMKDAWVIGRPKKQEKEFGRHPTQKPIEILERLILATTNEEDTILDPFMGSGTTGVAAIANKRKFIGIEKESEYLELSNQRLANAYELFSNKTKFNPTLSRP